MTAHQLHRIGDVTGEGNEGGIAVVSLDRPPDNQLSAELVTALADMLEYLDAQDAYRAIVLRANGKHFCAGAALGPRAGDERAGIRISALYEQGLRLFATRKPIVAAVQGAAIGGGLGLALAADFRVGTPGSTLSANFARLGFHHGFGMTVTLPAVVGQQTALDLLYTGRRLRGEQARLLGLFDELAEPAELDQVAKQRARDIAESAPLALESIRATMRLGLADRVREAMLREQGEQRRLTSTQDFAEGVAAYAARRPPVFKRK
jgi:enoyl-CoA hydratase/carnithine racemase